jgi:hypothetical protein
VIKETMKVSTLKKRMHTSVVKVKQMPFIVDEFHMLAGSDMKPFVRSNFEKPSAARLLVTQFIVRGKRDKQILVGSMRDAKTGHPYPPTPKKFLPAQVLRRQEVAKA